MNIYLNGLINKQAAPIELKNDNDLFLQTVCSYGAYINKNKK